MTGLCFVDTNVLVYGRDASEVAKQARAQEWLDALWRRGCGRTGIQVLNEDYVTVTRRLDPGLEPAAAWQDVEDLFAWDPVRIDAALMKRGREVATRFGLSWWDALVVAAAQASECRYLLTEDLQGGQRLDGVQVVNPFQTSPSDLSDRPSVNDGGG